MKLDYTHLAEVYVDKTLDNNNTPTSKENDYTKCTITSTKNVIAYSL